MSDQPTDKIYVIVGDGESEVSDEGPPGEAVRIFGRGHRAEEVGRDEILRRFGTYTSLAGDLMATGDAAATGFQVDEITLHLGITADIGLAFVGHAGVEAAIDVVLRRK